MIAAVLVINISSIWRVSHRFSRTLTHAVAKTSLLAVAGHVSRGRRHHAHPDSPMPPNGLSAAVGLDAFQATDPAVQFSSARQSLLMSFELRISDRAIGGNARDVVGQAHRRVVAKSSARTSERGRTRAW